MLLQPPIRKAAHPATANASSSVAPDEIAEDKDLRISAAYDRIKAAFDRATKP